MSEKEGESREMDLSSVMDSGRAIEGTFHEYPTERGRPHWRCAIHFQGTFTKEKRENLVCWTRNLRKVCRPREDGTEAIRGFLAGGSKKLSWSEMENQPLAAVFVSAPKISSVSLSLKYVSLPLLFFLRSAVSPPLFVCDHHQNASPHRPQDEKLVGQRKPTVSHYFLPRTHRKRDGVSEI